MFTNTVDAFLQVVQKEKAVIELAILLSCVSYYKTAKQYSC